MHILNSKDNGDNEGDNNVDDDVDDDADGDIHTTKFIKRHPTSTGVNSKTTRRSK